MKIISILILLALSCCAQSAFPSTTLSMGTTANYAFPLIVASASAAGIHAPDIYNGGQVILYINQEAVCVNNVWFNRFVTVSRGCQGTATASHTSGATVYAGPGSYYAQSSPGVNGGACVAASYRRLPIIVLPAAQVWNCTGGFWVVT